MRARASMIFVAILGIAVAVPAAGQECQYDDRIDLIEVLDILVTAGVPGEVAIRDETYVCLPLPVSSDFERRDPKPPDLDCDGEDADDPRCDDDKPTHIDP